MHSQNWMFVAPVLLALMPIGSAGQLPDGSTRMVDVLGYATRVIEVGLDDRDQDEPILVLMAGAGSPLETWGEWISEVSALAPVVSYDRPGIGQSTYDNAGASPRRMTEHAHAVLAVLEVPPPYVLVGHSWGGPLIQYYAGRYPSEVAGMVYLDPTDSQESRCEMVLASTEEECATRRAALEQPQAGLNLPPGRMAEQEAIREWINTPPGERGVPDSPRVPTAYVLRTRPPPAEAELPAFMDGAFFEEYYRRRLNRYAARILGQAHATLVVATDAGHFVHRADPRLATEAVRRVISAVGELRQ